MLLAKSWSRQKYIYTSDKGQNFVIECNDYLADAASLERYDQAKHGLVSSTYGGERLRHVRVKSMQKNSKGSYDFTRLIVQADNPLWTGSLGQTVYVAGHEMSTVEKIKQKSRWI